MSPRPVIFISAVTTELKSARDLVDDTLRSFGIEVLVQDILSAQQGDLRTGLQEKIDGTHGVIHLVGQRYGFAPTSFDDPLDPHSYTQFEARYALRRKLPVWFLILDKTYPPDTPLQEGEDQSALQQAWRARLRALGHFFENIADRKDVKILAQQIAHEIHKKQSSSAAPGDETAQRLAKIEKALEQLAAARTEAAQSPTTDDPAAIEARAYEALERKLGLPAGTLAVELPQFAKKLLRDPHTSPLNRARAFQAEKKYAEAETAAVQAREEALAAAGQPIRDAIAASELAGSSAEKQIHYADALAHLRAAAVLTHRERDPLEWARVQFALAHVLYDQGHADQAEPPMRQAYEVRVETLGPEHADTLTIRNNLANTLRAQGRFEESERELRAVLALRERVLGSEDLDSLTSRNNLARTLHAQGHYLEAELEHRTALVARERLLGPEHPDSLRSRNNLAAALQAQGKPAEAEREHRAVLAVRERVLGPEHPDSLASRNNLALALQTQGKHAEAEQEHRAVLGLSKRVLGLEHPDSLASGNNLALALQAQGKYAEAEREHRAVLALSERVLGPDHPDSLRSRNNLDTALDAQGKPAEAEREHRAVLAVRERVLGPDHPDSLRSRNNLASALQAQGKPAEAEQEHRAVLGLCERILGARHPDVFQTCYHLALVLQSQGKLVDSLAFAQRAREGLEEVLGQEHLNSKDAGALCEKIQAELAAEEGRMGE